MKQSTFKQWKGKNKKSVGNEERNRRHVEELTVSIDIAPTGGI